MKQHYIDTGNYGLTLGMYAGKCYYADKEVRHALAKAFTLGMEASCHKDSPEAEKIALQTADDLLEVFEYNEPCWLDLLPNL